jgi:hypothetical protein
VGIDPDEQVQAVVHPVLEKFEGLGGAGAVSRYLARHGFRFGVRPIEGPNRGQLEWRRPNRSAPVGRLHRPIYAGVYSYGRHPKDPRREARGRPGTGRTPPPTAEWEVLSKDHLPAYISRDRYLTIRGQLEQDRSRTASKGVPREGATRLGGPAYRGRCGRRLAVGYSGEASRPRYRCQRAYHDYRAPMCQSLSAGGLDELIGGLVPGVLEPAAPELSLSAGEGLRRERDRQAKRWQQRRERARYEAERAARHSHSVEPENRPVARELERRWEQALLAQRRAEGDYDRFAASEPPRLTAEERDLIGTPAADLPALWRAASTTAADRQAIVRHLIGRVVVAARGESERIDVTVHWAGGSISRHAMIRSVARYEQLSDYDRLIARVAEPRAAGPATGAIAGALDREGLRPPRRGRRFTGAGARQLLSRRGWSWCRGRAAPAGDLLEDGEWWFADLASELDIPQPTVRRWVRRGWLHWRQLSGAHGRWVIWADREELDRLRRLRASSRCRSDQPFPAELTTPRASFGRRGLTPTGCDPDRLV